MRKVQLKSIPNQKLSTTINGNTYDISIKQTSVMIADITINDVLIASGIVCKPNMPLMPYDYAVDGNFFFIIDGEEYPDYTLFGTQHNLYYLTADEVATI